MQKTGDEEEGEREEEEGEEGEEEKWKSRKWKNKNKIRNWLKRTRERWKYGSDGEWERMYGVYAVNIGDDVGA